MHLFLARDLSDVGRGDFELEHEEADMAPAGCRSTTSYAAVLDGRVGDGPLVIAVAGAPAPAAWLGSTAHAAADE